MEDTLGRSKERHDLALRDAEGWLAQYKETGDLKALSLAINWLQDAQRNAVWKSAT